MNLHVRCSGLWWLANDEKFDQLMCVACRIGCRSLALLDASTLDLEPWSAKTMFLYIVGHVKVQIQSLK